MTLIRLLMFGALMAFVITVVEKLPVEVWPLRFVAIALFIAGFYSGFLLYELIDRTENSDEP